MKKTATLLRRILTWFKPTPATALTQEQVPGYKPTLAMIIEPAIELAGGVRKLANYIGVSGPVITHLRNYRWEKTSQAMYEKVYNGCERILSERKVLVDAARVRYDADKMNKDALIALMREHLDDTVEDILLVCDYPKQKPTRFLISDEHRLRLEELCGRIAAFKRQYLTTTK